MTEDRPAPPPPSIGPSPLSGYGQLQPRHSVRFWVAIIIGSGFALLILAAVAIPEALKLKKHWNELTATRTMRTVGSAEIAYNSTYPGNGYACSLSALGGDPKSGAPTAQAAQLIDPTLAATGYKNGYFFAVTCTARTGTNNHDISTSYRLTAIPVDLGFTGDQGYCSDESAVIKYDPAGSANCTQPLP